MLAHHSVYRLTQASRRRHGQNAILDRGMSTLLATVAVLAVLGAYYVYQNSNDAQAQVSQINAIAATAKALYQNAPNTSDLVTNTVAASGNLPTAWVTGASPNAMLLSINRNPITVATWTNATGPNTGFQINVTGVSNSTCITLMTTTFGSGFRTWGIGNTYYDVTTPPTPTQAQALCTGNNTAVNVYFR